MVGAGDIEMPADGIAVECNEHHVAKLRWHELQLGVAFRSDDWLAVYEEAVLELDLRLTQCLAKIRVDFSIVEISLRNGTWVLNETHNSR